MPALQYFELYRRPQRIKVLWPQAMLLPSSIRVQVPHQSFITWLLLTRSRLFLKAVFMGLRARFDRWEKRVLAT